jgi:hypothetical protein
MVGPPTAPTFASKRNSTAFVEVAEGPRGKAATPTPLARTHTPTACTGVAVPHRGKTEGSKRAGAGDLLGAWGPPRGPCLVVSRCV